MTRILHFPSSVPRPTEQRVVFLVLRPQHPADVVGGDVGGAVHERVRQQPLGGDHPDGAHLGAHDDLLGAARQHQHHQSGAPLDEVDQHLQIQYECECIFRFSLNVSASSDSV